MDADPLLGAVLDGQFTILRKLGEGGFGAVYEGEQPSMRRKVAIKTLHAHLASRPAVVQRFQREGAVASQLEHPSVVKMFSSGRTEQGVFWLAMEFLTGHSLAERIQRGVLSVPELLLLLEPICEVLEEAHGKGIFHRDLKPENIMLLSGPRGRLLPKVLDFGIARILEADGSGTNSAVVTGSPRYMPPEQWRGLKHADARSDQYALGMIVYECLTGRLPFVADSMAGWVEQHCLGTPLPLERALVASLPGPFCQAVMKSIARDPEARFLSVIDFLHALRDSAGALAEGAAWRTGSLPSAAVPLATDAPILRDSTRTTPTPPPHMGDSAAPAPTQESSPAFLTGKSSPVDEPTQTTPPVISLGQEADSALPGAPGETPIPSPTTAHADRVGEEQEKPTTLPAPVFKEAALSESIYVRLDQVSIPEDKLLEEVQSLSQKTTLITHKPKLERNIFSGLFSFDNIEKKKEADDLLIPVEKKKNLWMIFPFVLITLFLLITLLPSEQAEESQEPPTTRQGLSLPFSEATNVAPTEENDASQEPATSSADVNLSPTTQPSNELKPGLFKAIDKNCNSHSACIAYANKMLAENNFKEAENSYRRDIERFPVHEQSSRNSLIYVMRYKSKSNVTSICHEMKRYMDKWSDKNFEYEKFLQNNSNINGCK